MKRDTDRNTGSPTGWSLGILILGGLALLAVYGQTAARRLDEQLASRLANIMEWTALGQTELLGASAPPRSLRFYSGEYWQIAQRTPQGLKVLDRSRSLADAALPAPAGSAMSYDAEGPLKQPLRIVAREGQLPGVTGTVLFLAAEDRSTVDNEVRDYALRLAVILGLVWAGLLAAPHLSVRRSAAKRRQAFS